MEPAQPKPRVDQPGPQPVPKQNKSVSFRISGIPPLWDSERLEKELETIDTEFNPKDAEISGPFPDVYGSSTQTALLGLSECTPYFTFEPKQEKNNPIEENGRKFYLVLDRHFHDLTPLNQPEGRITMELVNPQKCAFQMLTCLSAA